MTREEVLSVLVAGLFIVVVVLFVVGGVLYARLAIRMKREYPAEWADVRASRWRFWSLMSRQATSLNDPAVLLLFRRFRSALIAYALVTFCWLVTVVLSLLPSNGV